MMLFLKELKKNIFSVSFLVFAVVTVLALYSQGALDFSGDYMTRPEPGGNYGTKNVEIPEIVMPAALEELWSEFSENRYITYPIGFIKTIRLNERQQAEMAEILSLITDEDMTVLLQQQKAAPENGGGNGSFTIDFDNNGAGSSGEEEGVSFTVQNDGLSSDPEAESPSPDSSFVPTVRGDMEYSRFKELMQRADDLLGGGSSYAANTLIGFGAVPLTYEEALERYELAVSRDKITGGYARLFSDYAGVMVLSILPVFLGVSMSLRDRRAKMTELVHVRQIRSARLILARYCAVIVSVMGFVILLSYISNASAWGNYKGAVLDYLAPLKYDLGWLMPQVMLVSALGMLLTELTDSPIAIAVQGLWWLMDTNLGYRSAAANYSLLRLSPRHNSGPSSWFRTWDYLEHFDALMANRLALVVISLLLVAGTILVFDAKRKGKIHVKIRFKA